MSVKRPSRRVAREAILSYSSKVATCLERPPGVRWQKKTTQKCREWLELKSHHQKQFSSVTDGKWFDGLYGVTCTQTTNNTWYRSWYCLPQLLQMPILFAMFFSSLFTCLNPVSARVSPVLLCVVRAAQGLVEGPIFPTMYAMAAKWLPKREKTFLMGCIVTGKNPFYDVK